MSPKRSVKYKEDQKAEIIAAARRCFIRLGCDGTTTREIAKEARVSTGAVYTYFDKKEDLLDIICRHELENRRSTLRPVLSPVGSDYGSGLAEALETALGLGLMSSESEMREGAKIELLLWSEAARNQRLGEEVRLMMLALRQAMTRCLRTEQAAYSLGEDHTIDVLGAVLASLSLGLSVYELLAQETLDRDAVIRVLRSLLESDASRVAASEQAQSRSSFVSQPPCESG